MKLNGYIKIVRDFMVEMSKTYRPAVAVKPEIYYANGNDGTDFDWGMNDRTCEFYIYYRDSGIGYMKAWVEKDGSIKGYVYQQDNDIAGESAKVIYLKDAFTRYAANRFRKMLEETYDKMGVWDSPIASMEEMGK